MIIEFDEECESCSGTGIYTGMAEHDGVGVICSNCKGTGCHHYKYEHIEFKEKKERKDITHVIECNPGIIIGEFNNLKLSDFGGMSYKDWVKGKPFIVGMEMRNFTCPCWWYQSANYTLKPDWNECIWGEPFSECKYFKEKEKCWKRWDKEFNK